ncbi:MAG: substrate-binding domain-containing protein [Roseobacter sp.]
MNLRDLSKHLNLSQTTVSRALNGYPEVGEHTRRRVAQAAEQFNYRPNARAQRLATGRSMSIGHIIPLSGQDEIANVVFADFIAGAGEVYALHGYTLTLSVVRDEDEMSAYRGIVDKGAVDGVIVHSPRRDDRRIHHLSSLDIPFLVHGRARDCDVPYLWLDVDNQCAFRRGTEHLTALGHERIGLINGEEALDFAWRRREGYVDALRDADLQIDPKVMRSGAMSEPFGYRSAREMLAAEQPPTAFICASIVLALGVRRAIEDASLTMGKDVSVVCFDDALSYLPNDGAPPVFTALRSSVRDAGRRCAQMLLAHIDDPSHSTASERWQADLILGASTGPPPRKATP